jgi:biotin carboxylase
MRRGTRRRHRGRQAVTGFVGKEAILLIGFSAGMLPQLAEVLPARSVLVVEDPDVVRKRSLDANLADLPVVSRLIECPYQVPGALQEIWPTVDRGRIAAVFPAIEYGVEAAAAAAEELHLPGAGSFAAGIFRNKYRLRQLAGSAGIGNPRYALVADATQAAAFLQASEAGRCVLKPTARQASAGVRFVRSAADIQIGWEAAAHPDDGPGAPAGIGTEILIEDVVTGDEFSVEMLVSRRVPCFANVTAKHVFPGPFPVERGHDVPAPVPAGTRSPLIEATARLAEAAKISDGILHAEWILSQTGPVLVECAARMPGDLIPRLIRLAYGFPLVTAYLDVMLGKTPAPPGPAAGAAIRFLSAPPGTVVSVEGAEEASAMPGIVGVWVPVRAGDTVRPLRSSWDRIGHVLARGDDPGQAAARAEAALARIRVITTASTPQ